MWLSQFDLFMRDVCLFRCLFLTMNVCIAYGHSYLIDVCACFVCVCVLVSIYQSSVPIQLQLSFGCDVVPTLVCICQVSGIDCQNYFSLCSMCNEWMKVKTNKKKISFLHFLWYLYVGKNYLTILSLFGVSSYTSV